MFLLHKSENNIIISLYQIVNWLCFTNINVFGLFNLFLFI